MKPLSTKLVSDLGSDDPDRVREAILAVSEFSDPRYLAYLTPLFKHKNVGIRYFAKKVAEALALLPPLTDESGPDETLGDSFDGEPAADSPPAIEATPPPSKAKGPVSARGEGESQAPEGDSQENQGRDFDISSLFHRNRKKPDYSALKKSMTGDSSPKRASTDGEDGRPPASPAPLARRERPEPPDPGRQPPHRTSRQVESLHRDDDDSILPPVPQTAFERKALTGAPASRPPSSVSGGARTSQAGGLTRPASRIQAVPPVSKVGSPTSTAYKTSAKTSYPASGGIKAQEEEYIEEMLMKLDSQSSQDRMEGIFNLKRIKSEEVAISLLELAEREKDPLVLSVLVKVLPELAPFSEESSLSCLRTALKSEDQRVRANAVESLEKLWKEHWDGGNEREVFQLCLPLIQDSDNRVKANALKLFFCFNRDQVLLELTDMLSSGEIWMRDSALYALGEIKDEGVIPLLLGAVADPNEEIRLKAYKKLAETGRKAALIPLLDKFVTAVDDESHELHYIANMVLRKLIETVSAGEDEDHEAADILAAATMPSVTAGVSIAPDMAEVLLACGYWNFQNIDSMINELISSGQARLALTLLESIENSLSGSKMLLAKFAELNLLAGHFTKAMEIYETLVNASPDNPVYVYKLGEIYLINCLYDKAMSTLEKAVEIATVKTHPRRLLATASLKKGLLRRAYKEAIFTCEAASVELPQEIRANVLTELSVFFEEAGELETSAAILEKLSETCADDDITFRLEATRNRIRDKSRKAAAGHVSSERLAFDTPLGSAISDLEDITTKVLSERIIEIIETAPTGPIGAEEIALATSAEPPNSDLPVSPGAADAQYPEASSYSGAPENLDLFDDPEVSLMTRITKTSEAQCPGVEIPDELLESILGRLDPRYGNPKIIGKGGMGVVLKAKDSKLGREVALKVLPEHLCIDEEIFARFLREAQAAAQLNHFNIVGIYDIVTQEGFAYIVMEFVDGFNLRQLLKKKGRIPVPQVREIGKQLMTAFICAHDRGVIHRDIKPDNVMINSSGVVKIMDFGLAKADFSETITRVGMIMGTSFYMAPEQIKGLAVDKRTDIYSIGITLYELLTGKPPFTKGNVSYQHIHVQPDPPSSCAEGVSAGIDSVVMKCIAKEPDDRYSDCRELLRDWNDAR